ncbi:MAG: hypothetical protein J7L14_00495, partial [Candidatus Diapherotrites archaeon]|nr:hypothetical protein [Candidatus Diapherotrites archaeon]
MLERGNLTHEQIAAHFGLSRTAVTQYAKQWEGILAIKRRKVRKQEKTPQEIVEEVKRILHERGAMTSIRELAKLVGVSKTTIRKILRKEPGIVAVQLNESKLRPLYLITTRARLAEALAELSERNVGYFIRAVTRIIREQPQVLIGFVGDVRAI